MLVLNSESKDFCFVNISTFCIICRKPGNEIPQQQLLLRSERRQHTPQIHQQHFLPCGRSFSHTIHWFCPFSGGSIVCQGGSLIYVDSMWWSFPKPVSNNRFPKQILCLHQVYVLWLNLLFNTILPLAVLLILNTAIYRKLNKVIWYMN